ncbi:MAG: MBL fold metallo-hydrolase [Actinomycetota bacterium]|nr:MBL fold metallo-hydrolase [Actinomycetota bacterium]
MTEPVPTAPARIETLLAGSMMSTDQGEIAFCSVNLIEATGSDGRMRRIIVDTGHIGRHGALRQALASRGLSPSDVDTVVLTHAHWDHVQNVSMFPAARVLVHSDELRYARTPHPLDRATPPWTAAILDRNPIIEVAEGDEVAPGVTVIEAPGHSPGTLAVAVTGADGMAVITGDAIQDGRVALEGRNALVFFDEERANASVRKLVALAEVVYPGHDRAFRIEAGRLRYLEPLAMRLTHLRPDLEGLSFDPCEERTPVIMPTARKAPPG